MPRLGKTYPIEIDVTAKPKAEYQTDEYFEMELPTAPAVMVADEIIVEGSDVSEYELEACICRHLGLPEPQLQKKGVPGRRFSLSAVWRSWRSLPLWVQVWVGLFLIPVNAAAFLLIDTPTGKAAAIATIFVVMTNIPIMLYEGGMSRLMAVPHLVAWIPLSVFIIVRFISFPNSSNMQTPELAFAFLLLTINGISLVFDAIDTIRWCRGQRDIPGHG